VAPLPPVLERRSAQLLQCSHRRAVALSSALSSIGVAVNAPWVESILVNPLSRFAAVHTTQGLRHARRRGFRDRRPRQTFRAGRLRVDRVRVPLAVSHIGDVLFLAVPDGTHDRRNMNDWIDSALLTAFPNPDARYGWFRLEKVAVRPRLQRGASS